jgi:P4 family phage/plasmid primase-like protien
MKQQDEFLEIVKGYCRRGWSPIRVPHQEKGPIDRDWQNFRIKEENVEGHFKKRPSNVGVLLGEPSNGLVDVDLDSPEAAQLAPRFLPETAAFGRPHKPRSHLLFRCPGLDEIVPYDIGEEHILEIRGSGQTIFPPSLYKGDKKGNHRGEPIGWDDDREPVEIDPNELKRQVGKLAAAAVVLRKWTPGSRDELATALAGVLLRSGWGPEEVDHFVGTVAEQAGDEELRQRFKADRLASKLEEDGGRVPGMKKLREIVGEEAFTKIQEWLGLKYGGTFFSGNTFIPEMLVKHILESEDLFQDGSTIYRYDREKGFWKPIHEDLIGQKMEEALGIQAKRARIADAMYLLKLQVFKDTDGLMQDQGLVNLSNGMLNIRTRELVPHDKKYYSRTQIPIRYDPSAKPKLWVRFLEEIFPDDPVKKITLQDFSGYCLFPKIFIHECLFLIGVGANGKSVFINTLCKVIGPENVSALAPHHLSEKFLLGILKDKLLNASSEVLAETRIDENIFKQVVSGDLIQADEKFKKPFSFRPVAKHIFSMNEIPLFIDKTHALKRRVIVVTFNQVFADEKQDKYLEDKLAEELPGILNWCLDGLERVMKSQKLTVSESMEEDKERFFKYLDPFLWFIEEKCDFGEEHVVGRQHLYHVYQQWCAFSGVRAMTKPKFFERIRETYHSVTEDTYGKNKFKGIGVREGGEDECEVYRA